MIIPALDLSGGRVVRLKQGDFDKKTVFDVDPIQRIRIAANQGAELIHIVDLDGAKDPERMFLPMNFLISSKLLKVL